jgi:23S rRNA pseudouridine2605 synthase
MDQMRLNKYLAHFHGISRREADLYIQQNRVLVNGKIASLGNIVKVGIDNVTLDNSEITKTVKRYSYLLLNKPVGYVCSRKKQGTNPTIYELLPREFHSLKVAGRLDKDSQGLVLLTDDGDAIFKLTHPKFGKIKQYNVSINKPLTTTHFSAINNGIELEDGTSKLSVKEIELNNIPNSYQVTMQEGRNRQIRRTFKHFGYTVTFLERTTLGPYRLSDLKNRQFLLI